MLTNERVGNIGDRVRELRKSIPLGQSEFAKKLDVSQAAISLVENTGEISLDLVVKISDTYKCDLVWLVKGSNKKPEPIVADQVSSDNQSLSRKLIELYEERLKDKDVIIKDKDSMISDKLEIIQMMQSEIDSLKTTKPVRIKLTRKKKEKHT